MYLSRTVFNFTFILYSSVTCFSVFPLFLDSHQSFVTHLSSQLFVLLLNTVHCLLLNLRLLEFVLINKYFCFETFSSFSSLSVPKGNRIPDHKQVNKEIASINMPPMGSFNSPNRVMICSIQGGVPALEAYVEEFIGASHLTICSDIKLMEVFWIELKDKIRLVMPCSNSCWTLAEYISFAMWVD